MEDIKKEFEEKFCYEMMNFDHTNRHHYIVPDVIEKPQVIIDWIEQKIKDAKEEGFQAGCDFTCKQYKEGE